MRRGREKKGKKENDEGSRKAGEEAEKVTWITSRYQSRSRLLTVKDGGEMGKT